MIYPVFQFSYWGSPSILISFDPPPRPWNFMDWCVCCRSYHISHSLEFAFCTPWYSLSCSPVPCILSNLVIAFVSLKRFSLLFGGSTPTFEVILSSSIRRPILVYRVTFCDACCPGAREPRHSPLRVPVGDPLFPSPFLHVWAGLLSIKRTPAGIDWLPVVPSFYLKKKKGSINGSYPLLNRFQWWVNFLVSCNSNEQEFL